MNKYVLKMLVGVVLLGSVSSVVGAVDSLDDNQFRIEASQLLDEVDGPYRKVINYLDDVGLSTGPDFYFDFAAQKKKLVPLPGGDSSKEWHDRFSFLNEMNKFIRSRHENIQRILSMVEQGADLPYYYFSNFRSRLIKVNKNDRIYQDFIDFRDRLETLYQKMGSHGIWLLKKDPKQTLNLIEDYNVYEASELKDVLLNSVIQNTQSVENRVHHKHEIKPPQGALVLQKNWSFAAVAVLIGLLLESLREKSYFRRGAYALWNKARRLFRTEQLQSPKEQSLKKVKELHNT